MRNALHFGLGQAGAHAAFAELQAKLAAAEKTGGIQLAIANSLWPQKGIRSCRIIWTR
jgi:serpin B